MLNKNVFKDGMQNLIIFFPNWNVDVENPEVMKAWYLVFKDSEQEAFENMISNYIKNEIFNPTVASLNKYYKEKPKRERVNSQKFFLE